MIEKCVLSIYPLEEMAKNWYNVFIKCTVEFISDHIVSYGFHFFNSYKPIQIVSFFLYEFGLVESFDEIVHFINAIKFSAAMFFCNL